MWDTASSPASRLLLGGWAVFAVGNIALMFALPGDETIPFHFVWISFALVHGLRPWRVVSMLAALCVIAGLTFTALWHNMANGYIGGEELAEVPLMAAIFLVMVWHVRRRQAVLRQVELMAAVERRRAEAQQLFVRVSSHELRTPLTVARGYTELILAADADPAIHEDAGVVLEELLRLERKTARLLTLMLVDTAAQPVAVDFDDALDRVVHRWDATARRRWEVTSDVGIAMVNIERMETALDCLLENAVKFTEEGDVISLRAWKAPAELCLEVRDSGHGIPPDDLPHIFDYFATGHSAGAKAGTGLGLAIVRATVAARGGTVEVSSEPGAGSAFLLKLPDQVPDALPPALLSGADGHPTSSDEQWRSNQRR